MSPYLLDRPASAFRLDAVNKLVSELRDHHIGINLLRTGITNGYFPENNEFVQKFLSGPFKSIFNSAGPVDAIPVVRGLVNLANRYECDEIAVMTAHSFEPLIGKDAMKGMLPEQSVEFWEMHGRRFANAAISLPQILALTSGQLLGDVIFKSVVARSTALGMVVRMGTSRIILPGYTIFEGTIGFGWRLPLFMKGIMNFCGEIVKFNAYYMIASGIGGSTGGNIIGVLYMGAVGLTAGYANQWMRSLLAELRAGQQDGNLAWHLLEDRIGPMARHNLSRGLSQVEAPKTFRLATDGSAEKISGEITSLTETIEKKQIQMAQEAAERAATVEREAARQAQEAQAAAAREKTLAARAAKQAERIGKLRERFGVRITEAETLSAQLPADMRATFLEGIQRASVNPDLNAALNELRILIEDAKKAIAAAARPTPRSRATPQPRLRESPKGLEPRDVRIAEYRPTQVELEAELEVIPPTPPARVETTATDVERIIKHPSKELDDSLIRSITLGKVDFDRSALKEIQETYRTTPSIRGKLLRRLAEVSGRLGDTFLSGKNWTTLTVKDTPPCFRGKVGDHYRLLTQQMPNGKWNIYGLEVRGQLKPNSDAWFPK